MRSAVRDVVDAPADVIVGSSTPMLTILQSSTRTLPIVFTPVADPLGSGFVGSHARPGGNISGFTDDDPSIVGKWLELMKEEAPTVSHVTVLMDPRQSNHQVFLGAIQSMIIPVLAIRLSAASVRDRAEIEQAMTALAGLSNRGVLVLPGPVSNTQRETIVTLAACYRRPTMYPHRYVARDGGLPAYGGDQVDQWSGAAGHVDGSLRGAIPGECRSRRRPASSWPLTSRRPGCWDLWCRPRCSTVPTRRSNRIGQGSPGHAMPRRRCGSAPAGTFRVSPG